MTKKDYIAAAKIAAEYHAAVKLSDTPSMRFCAQEVENAFVKLFVNDGGRFNEERFREACRK